jgi:hypothetical protein
VVLVEIPGRKATAATWICRATPETRGGEKVDRGWVELAHMAMLAMPCFIGGFPPRPPNPLPSLNEPTHQATHGDSSDEMASPLSLDRRGCAAHSDTHY